MNTNKHKITKWGDDYYYLGQDERGINYYLMAAKWDCGWYWGGGYVRSFTHNRAPEYSRDIATHNHFNTMFFGNPRKNGRDAFKEFFTSSPFTDREVWTICELLKSFYIAREYSDMIHRGGAHYSNNPASDTIKNAAEYDRINTKVIPAIVADLYAILGGNI